MWFDRIGRATARRQPAIADTAKIFGSIAGALASVMILAGVTGATAQDANDSVLDGPAMLGGRTAAATPPTLAGDKTRTRFVIGLERAIEFQVSSLPNPNRVIVELPDLKVQLPTLAGGAGTSRRDDWRAWPRQRGRRAPSPAPDRPGGSRWCHRCRRDACR